MFQRQVGKINARKKLGHLTRVESQTEEKGCDEEFGNVEPHVRKVRGNIGSDGLDEIQALSVAK